MNQKILAAFSRPARAALEATCGTPDAAAEAYNRVADQRIVLKIGLEVMERNAAMARHKNDIRSLEPLVIACQAVLAQCAALECFMSTIELLYPELAKAKIGDGFPTPPPEDGNRIRNLDLDP